MTQIAERIILCLQPFGNQNVIKPPFLGAKNGGFRGKKGRFLSQETALLEIHSITMCFSIRRNTPKGAVLLRWIYAYSRKYNLHFILYKRLIMKHGDSAMLRRPHLP